MIFSQLRKVYQLGPFLSHSDLTMSVTFGNTACNCIYLFVYGIYTPAFSVKADSRRLTNLNNNNFILILVAVYYLILLDCCCVLLEFIFIAFSFLLRVCSFVEGKRKD